MSKYGNKKTVVDGITFDSQKEAGRYQELMLMLRAGKIQKLRLQPEFTIQEAFHASDGKPVRAVRYRADFSYETLERIGPDTLRVTTVEDVKGFRTKEYSVKEKLVEGFGMRVVEL